VVGTFGALSQSGVRRVLGFGIITSVGTMILGLAINTPLAIGTALFYLVQDILVKANRFLGAGVARRMTGSEVFGRTGGLWRAAPGIAVLLLVPLLSLAGAPPFSGFWAKLLLLQASLADGRPWIAAAILASGLLTLFAVARLWAEAVWSSHPDGDQACAPRAPAAMLLPVAFFALAILAVGLMAGPFIDLAQAAGRGLVDPAAYVAAVLPEAP
jgi:multicomponent Na+:H+ antiporter subunit D